MLSEDRQVVVANGEVRDIVVRVQVDPVYLERRSSSLRFSVTGANGELSATEHVFLAHWCNEYG